MALLQRLLLLPLLAPLLAVLLVAAINPRPAVALRLLTWTSPALPIGLWLSLAAAGGGALSAAATSLALRSAGRPPARSTASPRARRGESVSPNDGGWTDWPEPDQPSARSASSSTSSGGAPRSPHHNPQPVRPPGEPAPTVAVPFRVIRKGASKAPAPAAETGPRGVDGVTPAVAVGDGWDQVVNDDW